MNIISGIARGIKLDIPKGLSLRPTSVMARKSIFDSLRVLNNFIIVDLFAGTGSMGLEAASRGASSVYFIENNNNHADILKKNIDKAIKSGVRANLKLMKSDALKVHENLSEISQSVDLIFADPPYNESAIALETLLTSDNFANWAGDALLIFEIPSEASRKPRLENLNLWSIIDKRNFGQSVFISLKTRETK